MATINGVRIGLYVFLLLLSVVLLGLTANRLHYTTHLPLGDPLNGGLPFYDPIVAELLVCSLLGMLWAPFIIHILHRSYEYGRFSTFAAEMVGLAILFIMWLVGTAIATSMWGNLSWCHQYKPCRILTALVAIAWMGWIIIFALLMVTLLFAIANRAYMQPLHGRYDPRLSGYSTRGRVPHV